jgi:hypothetical protein
MSTRLKICQGTPSGDAPRLCDSCRYGLVRRGASEATEEVICQPTGRVRTRIVHCNRFEDRSKPTLFDMRQIAWVLDAENKRQQIGFVKVAEWLRRHEDEHLLPAHLR